MHKVKGTITSNECRWPARVARIRLPGVLIFTGAALWSSPAWAIPSPDLVISFFSNAAQFFGLLTVAAGGVVFFRRRDPSGAAGAMGVGAGVSPALRWLFKGLCLLLLVSIAANVLQWAERTDERNRRLQANILRSSTEDGRAVGDTSLKTLSYSDQVSHPLGMTTDELDALLAGDRDANIGLVDLREPEEKEMGVIEGFTPVRLPDLVANPDAVTLGRTETIFLCYSGNRSSEACQRLNAAGFPCRFVVGGYEKWRAEGHSVSLPTAGNSDDLRALPDYPNKARLLDTDEARRLVEQVKAIFIDVRYPGDFAQGHLPGAINIPIRKLETREILRQLEQIPKRPIVAPCYDKRSCFYAQILGLRLYRYGHDFQGRYSAPAEYVSLPAAAPHIEVWLTGQENGFSGFIKRPFRAALGWLDSVIGHFAIAVVVLSIALRLLMAPFSVKAERDRITQERMAAEVADLKRRLKDNPRRLSRALRLLFKKHELSPFWNLVGVFIQVPLFIVLFVVVDGLSAVSGDSIPGIGPVSSPDPAYALPGLLGLFSAILLHLHWRKSGVIVWASKIVIVGGLFWLAANLNAGANVYLVVGVAIMTLQTVFVGAWMKRRETGAAGAIFRSRQPLEGRVVSLADAGRLIGAGRKAERLAQMMAAGLPVPKGFVIPHSIVDAGGKKFKIPQRHARALNRLWRRQRLDRVAVRSSGLAEDGGEFSYAGVFESHLDIGRQDLEAAIKDVCTSLCKPPVATYDADAPLGGGIIVQEMVVASYAGILFTEHPSECGSVLVEMAPETTEGVTSGSVAATSYRFGRHTGQLIDKAAPPIDLGPLLRLARRVEDMFGAPQDIEWAYHNGRFVLLQSRDITHLARRDGKAGSRTRVLEEERHRLIRLVPDPGPDDPVLVQNELTELLPRPTPVSLSLMQQLWAPGGSRDLACQALGIPYEIDEGARPIVESVFGGLYINAREERACMSRGPGVMASFKLARSAEILEQNFHEDFLPDFLYEIKQREAIDLSRLSSEELLDIIEKSAHRFIREIYVQADIINIAANFYLRLAEQELRRRGQSTPTHFGQADETIVHRAMALLPDIRAGRLPASRFIELFGHRAPVDYELAMPRYSEDPSMVDDLVKLAGGTRTSARSQRKGQLAASSMSGTLALSLHRAHKFQILKEEAKHHCLRELAVIRQMLLEFDRQLDLDGAIFYLTLDEMPSLRLPESFDELRKCANRRQQQSEIVQAMGVLPPQLTVAQLEALDWDGESEALENSTAPLNGTIVAGDRAVSGRACVIDDNQLLEDFTDGDIVVARYIPAELTPVIGRAGAIVTELGSWLSHTSILARELNVTTVVGARSATSRIKSGEIIQVDMTGAIQRAEQDIDSEVVEFPDLTGKRESGGTGNKRRAGQRKDDAGGRTGKGYKRGLKR